MPLIAYFRGITARAWIFYVFAEIQLIGVSLFAGEAASYYRGAREVVSGGSISLILWELREREKLTTSDCDYKGIPGWWGVQKNVLMTSFPCSCEKVSTLNPGSSKAGDRNFVPQALTESWYVVCGTLIVK